MIRGGKLEDSVIPFITDDKFAVKDVNSDAVGEV